MKPCPVSRPISTESATHHQQTRLGVPTLDATVHALIERGVAKSTLTAYKSGKRMYLAFCSQFHFTPLPITEDVICPFVAFLFSSSLAYQSIRSQGFQIDFKIIVNTKEMYYFSYNIVIRGKYKYIR